MVTIAECRHCFDMSSNTFTVEIKGLDELLARYKKAPEVVEPVLQEAVSKSAAILAENTIPKNIPWKTGALARSFDPAEIGHLYARWFPRIEYARAVQFGLPPSPGRYVPAIKRRLTKSGRGMWPGFKGRFYMEKIRDSSTGRINELFRNAIKVVSERMKG